SLTPEGKRLLESHRNASGTHRQEFYAGITKPRELAHDSRLYDVFLKESDELERDGSRVVRVALDYELKGDYQRHLNRPERARGSSTDEDRQAFAEANGYHLVERGQLRFIRRGRRIWLDREDIDRWMLQGRQGGNNGSAPKSSSPREYLDVREEAE